MQAMAARNDPARGHGADGGGQTCLRERGRGTADARIRTAPVAPPAQRAGHPRAPRGGHRHDPAGRAGRGSGSWAPGRRRAAGLAAGQPADWVVLDAQHVALRGLPAPAMLSAHVFASHRTSAIDIVWIAGTCRVTQGRHAQWPLQGRPYHPPLRPARAGGACH